MTNFICYILICSFVALSCCDSVPYYEKYFDQTLNHYNYYTKPGESSTFKQRYLFQDKWWKKNGPIFFYTGNEGNIVTFWNNTGLMFELAPQFNALVVFCEHRFYGKSLPFGADKSYDHPHIDLLTVDQALADFAVFIDWFKSSIGAQDSPVIAFGGSYGGMLSAYMRFRYPNLILGSLAASAPIYLAEGQADRLAFFQDVTKDFASALPGCENAVRQGFSKMAALVKQGKTGLEQVSKAFGLCPELSDVKDVPHLIGWIRNAFANMAMMDYPYPTSFMAVLPGNPVKVACDKLLKADDALEGLAQATGVWYGVTSCSDIWTEYVECSDPTGCGLGPSGNSWSYQACTDFIMPDGTYNQTDMFPYLPFTEAQRCKFCEKRWGVAPCGNWSRINLWGKDIQAASNIIFSNGRLDPWHRGGVLKDLSDTLVAIVIDDAAHHLDLRSSNAADPASVVKARLLEKAWIHKWLQKSNSFRSVIV